MKDAEEMSEKVFGEEADGMLKEPSEESNKTRAIFWEQFPARRRWRSTVWITARLGLCAAPCDRMRAGVRTQERRGEQEGDAGDRDRVRARELRTGEGRGEGHAHHGVEGREDEGDHGEGGAQQGSGCPRGGDGEESFRAAGTQEDYTESDNEPASLALKEAVSSESELK